MSGEGKGGYGGLPHVVVAGPDGGAWQGPTWKWECLTCGVTEDGFIKERYAVAEGRNHETSTTADVS